MHGKIKLIEKHSSSWHDLTLSQVTWYTRVESWCMRVCVHSSLHVLECSHVENHPNCHYMSWSTSTWMNNVGLKFTCHPCTPLGFPIKFGPAHSQLSPNSNNPHEKPRSTNKFFYTLIYQLYGADPSRVELHLAFQDSLTHNFAMDQTLNC
jgi:hypothetical protein